MRLHRLELEGFGPFRERQVVDFDAFERDGIFLISGRTGAGKSSILDGISFALYGGVARYEGGERRLRSDHCRDGDATEVRLELTVAERRWRVTRAPEYRRPARRGGGTTTEPARAELEELVDGVWVGRAAKPREVGLLLDEVLGLDLQQFQQVILLAQNRFSRFLLAAGGERQQLLRTLFDSRRFEEYRDALDARRREAQQRLDTMSEHARTLLEVAERLVADGGLAAGDAGGGGAAAGDAGGGPAGASAGRESLAARRESVELAVRRVAYRLETLEHERARADDAVAAASAEHAARTSLARAHAERLRAQERLAGLEAGVAAIDADRERLERASAAEGLRAALDAVERAERAAEDRDRRAGSARAAWRARRDEAAGADTRSGAVAAADASATELARLVEEITGDLAVWAAAAAQEARLDVLERELADARAAVEQADGELGALDAQRALVPAELERLDALLAAARDRAAALVPAQERHDDLLARRAAADEAAELARSARAADDAYRRAADEAASASSAVSALLRRRLDGYAGELAAQLVDGEPCAVCGSAAHPRPAVHGADPVTDQAFAVAEHARDTAASAERAAAHDAAAARAALADASARAGSATPEELDAQLAAARAAVADAREAAAEGEILAARRAQLAGLDAESALARTALSAAAVAARERAAGLEARVAGVVAEVASARGSRATVAARVAALTALRDAARAVVDADGEKARADRALAEARADGDALLAASPFADAAQARAALADRGTIASLRARVADHAAALAATRQRLLDLELELAGAGEVGVDTDASAAALDAADTARTSAIAAEGDARHVAERLRDLALQIDDAYAGLAEQAEDAAAVARLADTVAGRAPNTMKMDLETFVLAAELEEIVAAANARLAEMSSGRYTLAHSDARAARGAASGLGIEVMDAHTGRARPPQSLSGGETFLASLALALGLAEVVTARAGGIRLDTLFIDEGFGSLDAETLELAMRTLDELRAGGRTVGVISHVEAMKEQLPAQLVVEATPRGPSVIHQLAEARPGPVGAAPRLGR